MIELRRIRYGCFHACGRCCEWQRADAEVVGAHTYECGGQGLVDVSDLGAKLLAIRTAGREAGVAS